MTFIPNWRQVLRRAWSVRLIVLAALLSGLEVVLPMLDMSAMPTGFFAALSGLVSAAALFARFLAQQPQVRDADPE